MSRAVTHGAKSTREYARMLQDYRVPAARIAVLVLVTAQPGDAETRRLYDAIPSQKVLAEFDPGRRRVGPLRGRRAQPVRPGRPRLARRGPGKLSGPERFSSDQPA
jgi:hypothetical protein